MALDPTKIAESSRKYYSTRPDSNLEKTGPRLNFTRPRLDPNHSNTQPDSIILNFYLTRPYSNLDKTRPKLFFTRPDSTYTTQTLDCVGFMIKILILCHNT